jgi:YegS/Rv2252/BmrU family lipid kinase
VGWRTRTRFGGGRKPIYWAIVKRARIVYNPKARNAPLRERLLAAARAAAPDWEIDLVETSAAGHAISLSREAAASGAGAVFACGGDGTVNEVVNGLAGSACALGVIRGGMGDVFAKEVGIPRKVETALTLQLTGDRRRFDLGRAGERYFLLMAGIGFDAAVVRAVPNPAKKRLGSTSYALWGARLLPVYQPPNVQLSIDGEARESELFWALLGNTRSYGGIIDITSQALVDDGLLDAYLFEGRGLAWEALTALKLALRRHAGAKGVTHRRLRELTIETPGLAVQADGEYLGETPMRFTVAAAALDVLLPAGRGRDLFGA